MTNQLVSSSSSPSSWRYDVFLSFSGEDTRNNFTDHLYEALVRNGINTFIDRQLTRGEEISPALLKAIEKAKISIVVFSKNYASSRWCLDELVKILQCRESKEQIVVPVFYKVDPSHVRNQKSSFGDAFTKLECKFKDNKEKIHTWRSALNEAANLSGHPVKEEDSKATSISNIVRDIFIKVLDGTHLTVAKHPVGIQSCVQEVKQLLGVSGNGHCVVGIWGTSGIGKTTIAKAVYNAIAHKFEGRCFLADVREKSASRKGVIQLQKTLLSKILSGRELTIDDVHHGISLIEKFLKQKKILLILDDVDKLERLDNLFNADWFGEGADWFGEGSRVIITTKDRGLLESYDVKLIYKVQLLEDHKALQLFSWNAFKTEEPPDDYLRLARRAIAYAQGLPLALNLIGSHLRNKSIDRWQAILDSYDSYEREPYTGIQRILEKSYDAWDGVVQQVFLDIACFFKGKDKDYVLRILRSSKLNVPQDIIELLVENAIITVERNRILMHDLLEKMGKHKVYKESRTEPGERSRLWDHKDVYRVLTQNRGTEKIRGIMVMLPEPDEIPLNAQSFLRMINLEIFINHNARFSGRVDFLPDDLRWIELGGLYNLKHTVVFNLPSNYHPRDLVMFDMSYSGIRQLKGFKNLTKLTSMNLSNCEFLKKIPDFSGIPNIEGLDLSNCTSLVEVDDSIGFLDKLIVLDLSRCSKLTRFATRLGLRSLQTLLLSGCTRLESFPEIEEGKMEFLDYLAINESGIRELPSSIAHLTRLGHLGAADSELQIVNLPTLCKCNMLIELSVVDLSGSNIVSLPDCISEMVNLEDLYLSGCEGLREIPQLLPPKLSCLYLNDCTSLEKIPKLPPMLKVLFLVNCSRLSDDELAKLENLLNEESLRRSKLMVVLSPNKVPKWIKYTSNHPTDSEEYDGGSQFSFEIPLNLQVGETLLGLALSFVGLDPVLVDNFVVINGIQFYLPHANRIEYFDNYNCATFVLMNLEEHVRRGDICRVIFYFTKGSPIESYGVHPIISPNQDGLLPLFWEPTSSLGKRPRPHGSSNIVDDEYDEQQQQWLSLSLNPAHDHLKRRQIDIDIEEEEQEQPSTLGDPQLRKRPRPHGSSDIVDDEYGQQQQQWLSLSSNPADGQRMNMVNNNNNVPINIEEEQEQTSTSDDPQFLIY